MYIRTNDDPEFFKEEIFVCGLRSLQLRSPCSTLNFNPVAPQASELWPDIK